MSNTGKWVVIKPEGEVTVVDCQPDNVLPQLYALIGCDTVEVVRLDPADGLDMWVDEEGMLVDEPEVNPLATGIASTFGFIYQPYMGTAVFAQVTEDGDTVGLSQKWLDRFVAITEGREDEG